MKILLLVDGQTGNFANGPKKRLQRLNLTKVVMVVTAAVVAATVPVSADIRSAAPVTE
jgi:hypothetical protein